VTALRREPLYRAGLLHLCPVDSGQTNWATFRHSRHYWTSGGTSLQPPYHLLADQPNFIHPSHEISRVARIGLVPLCSIRRCLDQRGCVFQLHIVFKCMLAATYAPSPHAFPSSSCHCELLADSALQTTKSSASVTKSPKQTAQTSPSTISSASSPARPKTN